MRGRLLVLSFVAGCYSPAPPLGAPCSSLGTCPDGLVCTAASVCARSGGDESPPPDGPPMMTPDGDTDDDGVPDELDNCPGVKNADQADEDGDKIGDECDGCPQIADQTQTDSDGDHIGDACDPNPDAADSRWKFEGFHTGVLPEWGKTPGWVALADALMVTAAGNANDMGEFMTVPIAKPGRTFDKLSIAITAIVTQTMGSDGEHDIGMLSYDGNLQRTVYCDLQQQGSSRFVAYEEWDDDASDPRARKEAAYPWKNGMTYQLTFMRQAKNYTCTVTGPEGTKAVSGSSDVAPNFEPSLDAFGVTAQVGSVLVVGSP